MCFVYRCRHEDDPVMRLETGLAHFNQDLVYDPKKTTYVWSPYAMTHAWLMRDMLSDRLKAFQVSLFISVLFLFQYGQLY